MAKGATLYLRGLPEGLAREVRAAAARRGTTLTAFVAEALADVLGLDRPADLGEDLAENRRWYEANRARLVRRYRGKYVAIHGRRVIDHDRDFTALAARVFARLGNRPVFMPKVTAQERVVHLPSPSLAGS